MAEYVEIIKPKAFIYEPWPGGRVDGLQLPQLLARVFSNADILCADNLEDARRLLSEAFEDTLFLPDVYCLDIPIFRHDDDGYLDYTYVDEAIRILRLHMDLVDQDPDFTPEVILLSPAGGHKAALQIKSEIGIPAIQTWQTKAEICRVLAESGEFHSKVLGNSRRSVAPHIQILPPSGPI
ncbi:MAG: hypothetical protein GC137_08650 [Alphaproteobacteria bacterium]|nr:hypothetical protein [Alphaproteobacteria bacterium]